MPGCLAQTQLPRGLLKPRDTDTEHHVSGPGVPQGSPATYGRVRQSSSSQVGRLRGSTGGRTQQGCCTRRRHPEDTGSGPACRRAHTTPRAPGPGSPRRLWRSAASHTQLAEEKNMDMNPCSHLPLEPRDSQQRPASTGFLRAWGSPAVTHVLRAGLWLLLHRGVLTFDLRLVDLLHVPKLNGTVLYA